MDPSREKEPVRPKDLPPEMLRISQWRGPIDVLKTWVIVGLVVVACRLLDEPLAYVAGVIAVAGLQNHLMVLFHHSIHYNMHPDRRVNDRIARWLLIAPMGQPWGIMRRAHTVHHTYLGQANDPDRWYYDLDLHGRRRPAILIGWLAANCLGGLVIPQVRKMFTGKRDATVDPGTERAGSDALDRLSIALSQAVLFSLLWLLGGVWWTYFVFWALAVATLGSGLNCFRTSLEHADPGQPPRRNYSFRSNPVERFFVAPFHMNYHWEHHLLMTVPYYQMPRLRRLLLDSDRYGDGVIVESYLARLRQIVARLRHSVPEPQTIRNC